MASTPTAAKKSLILLMAGLPTSTMWERLLIVQVEKSNGISGQHHAPLVIGHPREVLLDDLAGTRPIAGGVGEIAGPQDLICTQNVATLDTHWIVQSTPIIALLQVFARHALEEMESPVLVDHRHVTFVVVVNLPQPILEPANHRLGPVDLERWKSVPDARECHLRAAEHGIVGEAEEVVQRLGDVNIGSGLAWVGEELVIAAS